MAKRSPFRYFKTSPEIIRLAVILYIGVVRRTWLALGKVARLASWDDQTFSISIFQDEP
jgi:hypothetical protein